MTTDASHAPAATDAAPAATDAAPADTDANAATLPAPGARRENLTREEAHDRATHVEVVTTQVHLDLDRGPERFGSRSAITFRTSRPGPTFVDCTALAVTRVALDGEELDLTGVVTPTRLALPHLEPGEHHLEVVAAMAYQHEGKGLHRFVDPVDDRVYLHSQFEPFDAHLVYACFDQPDLKTTFELSVDAPAEWVVVANGPVIEQPEPGAAGRWRFAVTPRISPYITAVVAGAYTSVDDVYRRDDGSELPLGFHVRRSLAEYLDVDELAEVTRQGFGAFEGFFEQRYPGEKYDQLFVPEFSAGAMENLGCVTFSETYVFRSKVTDASRERRAETILHEMAHMWFGDLVTMRWWDDLWLNESFATFMAVLAQVHATRWTDAWVTFLDAEKAWAKYQDQLPSTHPVADAMPDVESVHQNFDGITYAKGASVLRQLVAWVGQDAFLAGCRDYFERHAWGNTELSDFLAALERTSGRDLAAWRDEWLRTTGVTTLRPHLEVAEDGTYRRFEVVQTAETPRWAAGSDRDDVTAAPRRHRVAIGLYDRTDDGLERVRRVELDVAGERTSVDDLVGVPTVPVILLNDDDLTYAKVELDGATTEVVTAELSRFREPLPRALVWAATWDMVRDGRLPAGRFLALVRRNVAAEDQPGVLQRLLQRAIAAVERYGDPAARDERLTALATDARAALEAAPAGSDQQLAWARHWAAAARGDSRQLADVRRLLDGDWIVDGLAVDTDLRWWLVTALTQAGAAGEELIAAELERDDTELGRRLAATARAAQPTADAKDTAWTQLLEDTTLSHTMSRQLLAGFSQLTQPEVLAPFAHRYFDVLDRVWGERSLDWAIEFSEDAFPHVSASDELLDRVDTELAREDLPRPLRRVLLEQRDTLVRTLAARALDRDA
jgi:aminopeptidase N